MGSGQCLPDSAWQLASGHLQVFHVVEQFLCTLAFPAGHRSGGARLCKGLCSTQETGSSIKKNSDGMPPSAHSLAQPTNKLGGARMLKSVKYVTGNERGVTLVMVALSLTVLLGMGALAIDAGMLYTARTEL